MSKSIWDVVGEDLKRVECEWCYTVSDPIYRYNSALICVPCLMKEDWDGGQEDDADEFWEMKSAMDKNKIRFDG